MFYVFNVNLATHILNP